MRKEKNDSIWENIPTGLIVARHPGVPTRRFLNPLGTHSCSCCGGGLCPCTGCADNAAVCCYQITVGTTDYVVYWDGDCSWSHSDNGITMTISGGTIDIEIGAESYSETFPSSTNCVTLSAFEVPNTVSGNSAYVTANGPECSDCQCYCEFFTPDEDPNAPCCYWFMYQGDVVSLSYGYDTEVEDPCSWGGFLCNPDETPVSLVVSDGLVTLTIGEDSYNDSVTPSCLTQFTLGPYTVYPSPGSSCPPPSTICITLTVAGITSPGDGCGCPGCVGLNNTYAITGGDAAVQQNQFFPVCAYAVWTWYTAGGYTYVKLSDCGGYHNNEDGLAIAYWRATTASLTTPGASLELAFYSSNYTFADNLLCDFTGSTATLSASSVSCICPAGPNCSYPEDYGQCNCMGGAGPISVDVLFPAGSVTGLASDVHVIVDNTTDPVTSVGDGFYGLTGVSSLGCAIYNVTVSICNGITVIANIFGSGGRTSGRIIWSAALPRCGDWAIGEQDCFLGGGMSVPGTTNQCYTGTCCQYTATDITVTPIV